MQNPVFHPFIAATREEKEEIIKNFFENDYANHEHQNLNKFLFLIGNKDTGRLNIIEKVAKECFGEDWENKIYIRKDEGQKFPYKLHAHKVESSQKVIFITDSRTHWEKWYSLYPFSKVIEFRNQDFDIDVSGNCIYKLNLQKFNIKRRLIYEEYMNDMQLYFENLKNQSLISSEVCDQIKNKMKEIYQDTLIKTVRVIMQDQIFNE